MRTQKREKTSSFSCGGFSFPPGPIFSPAVFSWRILPRRWHLNGLAEERRWAITAAEKLSLTSFHSPACCQTRWQLWRTPTWCFVFFPGVHYQPDWQLLCHWGTQVVFNERQKFTVIMTRRPGCTEYLRIQWILWIILLRGSALFTIGWVCSCYFQLYGRRKHQRSDRWF